jgi:2-oxoglutarate/2-oxoacid ferredoxin oxidoreductase subunit alpha
MAEASTQTETQSGKPHLNGNTPKVAPQPIVNKSKASNKNDVTWMVGGPAGYGINSSGEMFSRCFTRGGLNVFAYLEYPSLIRGGHNNYHIRVSKDTIYSQVSTVDLLVCLNRDTFDRNQMKVSPKGGIIYDHENFKIGKDELTNSAVNLYAVPLMKIVKDHSGIDVMRNTVALGASLALLKYPLDHLKKLITEQFAKKGDKVINLNIDVATAGYDFVNEHYDVNAYPFNMDPTENRSRILLNGNAAISYGAMKAGCKFFCAYPMTPASSCLTVFARHEEEMNIVVKQPEDELAAALYTIGASFAGVRAMTATSGGGFALMNESLSFAGIAEVPLVVVESQRPGPGTGLPTWTGQSDLQFVLNSGHDEFPMMVMAAGDVREAFQIIQHAFNYAERFHIPVIVLSDKFLSESLYSVETFDDLPKIPIDRGPLATKEELAARGDTTEDYPRYKFTDDGVSPRTIPGMPNARYIANSNEHDELGDVSEEADNRVAMHAKRMKKLETIAAELPEPMLYGPEEAELSIIGWGTSKGPILEAMKWLSDEGISINYLHTIYINPFPTKPMKRFLEHASKTLLIEGNFEAQFGQLIRQKTLLDVDEKFLKWDGRPFNPQEIVDKIKSIL